MFRSTSSQRYLIYGAPRFYYFSIRFIDFVDLYIIPVLDFGRLAVGFGLLTLPKMPELKNRKTDFFQPVNIDLNLIAYK